MTERSDDDERNGEAPEGIGHQPGGPGEGPKYYVDVEGVDYSWVDDEITVPQIRDLGNLPEDKPVIEIDLRTQEQRTLDEGETVELHPGMGFAEKFRYKRGWSYNG